MLKKYHKYHFSYKQSCEGDDINILDDYLNHTMSTDNHW